MLAFIQALQTNPNLASAVVYIVVLIACVLLVLVALATRAYVKLNGAKLSAVELAHLTTIGKLAIGAAEELGNREGLTSSQKLANATTQIETHFPNMSPAAVDGTIHGLLGLIRLGVEAADVPAPDAKGEPAKAAVPAAPAATP